MWTLNICFSKEIREKVKPGYDFENLLQVLVRKHSLELLKMIHTNYSVTPSTPYPFSLAIKNWTAQFVEDLLSQLSVILNGGLTDSIFVIQTFLREVFFFFLSKAIKLN